MREREVYTEASLTKALSKQQPRGDSQTKSSSQTSREKAKISRVKSAPAPNPTKR
jgi:hypothetical protein